MQSIAEIFNAEILKFARGLTAEYPTVPVEGMLAIWCKQQDMPLSTFEVLEGKKRFTTILTTKMMNLFRLLRKLHLRKK